jgi:uncharacterized protein
MRRRLLRALAALLVLATGLTAIGLVSARADPIVRRVSLTLPRWPAGAPPVTVALISDTHLDSWSMDEARLSRIVAQVNALKPDLVVLAGDFVNGHEAGLAAQAAPGLTRALAGLRAPLGAFAVLGNHDHWTGAKEVAHALAAARVTVLENRAVAAGPLAIGGVGDAYTHHDRTAATVAQVRRLPGAPLMVTHTPDIAPTLGAATPVLLAGHTHCGQWALPLIGAVHVPSRYGRRYLCGVIREGARTVVITGGVGTSLLPMRYGVPPDLWLVTLGPH